MGWIENGTDKANDDTTAMTFSSTGLNQYYIQPNSHYYKDVNI